MFASGYNAWHHMVIVWDGTSIVIYQDGADVTSAMLYAPFCNSFADGNLVLGQDQDLPGGGFDPSQAAAITVDTIAIYSSAWTSARAATAATCVNRDAPDLVSLYAGLGPGVSAMPDSLAVNPAANLYGGSSASSGKGPSGGACA
jgi:hypothetical protein